MREAINPASLPPPPGYSHVVRVSGGTTVHIAGQVAWDEEGNLVGTGDFEAQTRQVFANLVTALAAVDATPQNLVKIGIYVVDHDMDKLDVIRQISTKHLPAPVRRRVPSSAWTVSLFRI